MRSSIIYGLKVQILVTKIFLQETNFGGIAFLSIYKYHEVISTIEGRAQYKYYDGVKGGWQPLHY